MKTEGKGERKEHTCFSSSALLLTPLRLRDWSLFPPPYYGVILLVYSKFGSPCTCPSSFTTKAFQKHISKVNNNCSSLSTTELGNFNLVSSTCKWESKAVREPPTANTAEANVVREEHVPWKCENEFKGIVIAKINTEHRNYPCIHDTSTFNVLL